MNNQIHGDVNPYKNVNNLDYYRWAYDFVVDHGRKPWPAGEKISKPDYSVPFEKIRRAAVILVPIFILSVAAYLGVQFYSIPIPGTFCAFFWIPAIKVGKFLHNQLKTSLKKAKDIADRKDYGRYELVQKFTQRTGVPASQICLDYLRPLAEVYEQEYLPWLIEEYTDAVAQLEKDEQAYQIKREIANADVAAFFAGRFSAKPGSPRRSGYSPAAGSTYTPPVSNTNGIPMQNGYGGIDITGHTYGN